MFKPAQTFIALAGVALLANGCSSVGKAMGAGKNPPDEFAIVTKAPLTLPPDFALRPPKPGETRVERLSTSERTRQLLLGDSAATPPSNGELAVLQNVGALDVDPNIRAILSAENGGRAEKEASLANQLVFWQVDENGDIDDSEAPLRVDDAEAWHAERRRVIDSATGGGTVTISEKEQRILSLPGIK